MSSTYHDVVEPNASASHQGSIVVCAVVTWLISAVFVGLRLHLRGRLMRVLGSEDWVILASLVFSAGNSSGFIVGASYGLGGHAANVPIDNWQPMIKAAWVTVLCYTLTVCLTKVSVLLLYKRTLTYDWTRKAVWTFIVIVVLTSLLDIAVVSTACIPLNSFWDPDVEPKYCHSVKVYYAINGLQIGTDFLIYLLPLPVVWTLRAPREQKMMLITVFSFGFFICIVSIIRLVELATSAFNEDFLFTSVPLDYWTLIEVNTAIVCSCIMTLKPLLNRVLASSTRPNTQIQDHQPAAAAAAAAALGFAPPTIGSEPSRRKGSTARKQSWLSMQMARMDKSLQTVNEEVNLRSLGAAPGTGAWSSDRSKEVPPLDSAAPESSRRSHNSSVVTPDEQQADDGPLN
ncbi:hypothetical protein VMCG_08070 [Cytospora schulzeri]|uniref:Rhodopsin domain-containing protein n=1 Tax=Cytospora schulzeri TaxID=448051 RepID=A0A423VRA3_9PEZI|nr:hypothetical protein VMCG_08070 [Valsa malicola]